jgi:hypothetical protein
MLRKNVFQRAKFKKLEVILIDRGEKRKGSLVGGIRVRKTAYLFVSCNPHPQTSLTPVVSSNGLLLIGVTRLLSK